MAEDGAADPAVAQRLRAWASDKGLLALPSSKPALGDGDAEAAGSCDCLFDGGGEGDEQTQKAGKEQDKTKAKAGGKGQGKTKAKAGGKRAGQGQEAAKAEGRAEAAGRSGAAKGEALDPDGVGGVTEADGCPPHSTNDPDPDRHSPNDPDVRKCPLHASR